MRVPFQLVLVATVLATASAQMQVSHDSGLLITGDIDLDGCADVIVMPPSGQAQIYFGRRQAPWLVAGPTLLLPAGLPWDVPLLQGRHLYLAHASMVGGRGEVTVLRMHPNGTVQHRVTHVLEPAGPLNTVFAARLARLGRDLDGDREPDVLAVWSELPTHTPSAVQAAYLSPGTATAPIALPRMPGQSDETTVAAVLPVQNVLREPDTFVVTLSSSHSVGGFGVVGLGSGPRIDGGQWITGAPPLFYHGHLASFGTTTAGHFSPAHRVFSLTVKLHGGRTLHFLPWPLAPYLQPSATWIETSPYGNTLANCTHDFDGDGREEMVWTESVDLRFNDLLVVADPGAGRAYIQGFWLSPPAPGGRVQPHHGAVADFDGDGHKDLLLTAAAQGRSGSLIYLFRCDRSAGPGQPSLRREL